MRVIDRASIESALARVSPEDQLAAMEEAFRAYSDGRAVVPPVGHLGFAAPPADVHIKYGYIRGADSYVIKVASGFYDNPKQGLPANNGLVLVFDAATGAPRALLHDECYLTDLRTGLAGAVAARALGPAEVMRIGIIGCGVQARFQLRCLKLVTDCREVLVWGRDPGRVAAYIAAMEAEGFSMTAAADPGEVAKACDLIVTVTPTTEPLITAEDLRPGVHITAVGADAPGKQELAPWVLAGAEALVCDSVSQCADHGELAGALAAGLRQREDAIELGVWLAEGRRREPGWTTVADLTGVATQDIAIADLALRALGS